jgi:hypothetical protein
MSNIETKDFLEKYMEEVKEKKENFPSKVDIFKNKLKDLKIKSFRVEYSGSGDSGEIDEIFYEPNDLKIKVDVGTWKKFDQQSFEYKETNEPKSLETFIEDFCYELLEDNHSGWEINEGQSGAIEWDIKENDLSHNYTTYIEHSESESY